MKRTTRWLLLIAAVISVREASIARAQGRTDAASGEHAESHEETARTFRLITRTIDGSITGPLRKVDTVVQVGEDTRNRFTMHRVYKRNGRRDHRGSIVLLPSLVNNFREYLLDENHDPMQSLAATLALADYTVYGYSPRTANLPVNACSSGAVDCSILKEWDFNAYLSEIDYIREQVARDYDDEKPAIGGLSLGGMLGVAAVNARPSGYSGLLLWDAILYSADSVIVDLDTATCAALTGAIAAGIYYEEGLPNVVKQLTRAGEAAAVQFFGTVQPALGTPTFTQLVADSTHSRFEFASFPRVVELVSALNNVEALAVLRDAQCSFAGDRTFTANLDRFTAPVLAIKEHQGFGAYMQDTIDLMGSKKVRIQDDFSFGHLDAYLVREHAAFVEAPILDWLGSDAFPRHRR
jgi:pimeloyl-ACP methyl ester carboxylesterase